MFLRIFVFLIIIVAVVVGILAITLSREQIVKLIVFREFFDFSLPVLAFGALVKFLATCRHHCHSKGCKICGAYE